MLVVWRRFVLLSIVVGMGVAALVVAMVPADAANQVWTVATTPGLGRDTMVQTVDCVGSAWCVAVGRRGSGSSTQSLIAMGDGAQWSVVPSPDPLPISLLTGVSCVDSDFCIAVGGGSQTVLRGAENTIARWDGTEWTNVPSPQIDLGHPPGDGEGQYLEVVSCVSESWCAAVGEYGSYFSNTMAFSFLLWDGTSWSISAAPLVDGSLARPTGISCSSATSCVAVGRSQIGRRHTAVLWRWDGSTWSQDPLPDTGLPDSQLYGVSCVTATWCSAVGIHFDGLVPSRTLNVVWESGAWSVVPTPNLDDQYNSLKAISCVTTTSCSAVGDHFGRIGPGGSSGSENLIMSWDGSAWSVVPNVPTVDPTNIAPSESACEGTPCPSATNPSSNEGLWFLTRSGGIGPESVNVAVGGWANRLYGVSCFNTSGCRATGNAESGATSQAFVLAWNGDLAPYGPRFTG